MNRNDPEKIAWAMEILRGFNHLPGGPKNETTWNLLAKGLLDIFRDDDDPVEDIDLDQPERTTDTKGMKKSEWTIAQAHATFHRFPTLIGIRKIYSKHFKPADGYWDTDLLARLDED